MDFGGLFGPKTGDTHHRSAFDNPSAVSVPIGGTDSFSSVTRRATDSFGSSVNKNVEAGFRYGFGLGFSNGFGMGLSGKPGVVQRVQLYLVQSMARTMLKFGIVPTPFGQLPASLQTGLSVISDPSNRNAVENVMQLSTKLLDYNGGLDSTYQRAPPKTTLESTFGSQTVKAGSLQSEDNNIFQMVMKHQQDIEELKEENDKMRQILVEDLKVPQGNLRSFSSPCSDCIVCRRRRRRK